MKQWKKEIIWYFPRWTFSLFPLLAPPFFSTTYYRRTTHRRYFHTFKQITNVQRKVKLCKRHCSYWLL